jgi:hypothetical protein
MKIELKNVHFSERMSEETNAFTADLYINGKKVGEASNRGQGGPTDYFGITKEDKALIAEAEAYCQQLPEHRFTIGDEEHLYKNSLEDVIDDLLTKYLEAKDQKKNERLMKKGILIGSSIFEFVCLSYKVPIEEVLAKPGGKEIVANSIRKLAANHLKGNAILLNTNIPEEVIKMAGLSSGQYTAPKAIMPQPPTTQKLPKQQKGKSL